MCTFFIWILFYGVLVHTNEYLYISKLKTVVSRSSSYRLGYNMLCYDRFGYYQLRPWQLSRLNQSLVARLCQIQGFVAYISCNPYPSLFSKEFDKFAYRGKVLPWRLFLG